MSARKISSWIVNPPPTSGESLQEIRRPSFHQIRLATATMCHVSSEMVSLLVKPANHFTGAKPVVVTRPAIPGPENNDLPERR